MARASARHRNANAVPARTLNANDSRFAEASPRARPQPATTHRGTAAAPVPAAVPDGAPTRWTSLDSWPRQTSLVP